ncbi:hypothetical protein [Marinomonas atlantica]|nr:hypothetical protein [Marinomonas atlantica]
MTIMLTALIAGVGLFHETLADFAMMMFDRYLAAMQTLVDLQYFAC